MSTISAPTRTAALEVEDLQVAYYVRGMPREVLRGVSFQVAPGEAFGLVGESGCGKSTTAFAALRYLPANGRITGGRVLVDGNDVTHMGSNALRQFRATKASMVYQDPAAALNPVLTMFGISLGGLLGGSVIVESILGREGLGTLMVTAVHGRDLPLVMGIVLATSAAVWLGNLFAEMLQAWNDKRMRA